MNRFIDITLDPKISPYDRIANAVDHRCHCSAAKIYAFRANIEAVPSTRSVGLGFSQETIYGELILVLTQPTER
jgi:hypothetical protein